ncbi:MAG: M48 family metalloprotease [Bacteroidota bacterium]
MTIKKLRTRLVKTIAEKEEEPLMQAFKKLYLYPLVENPLDAASDLLPIIDKLTDATPQHVEDILILPLPMANAAAIRGDGLMITTGLLAAAHSQEDLAFIMAHELAHHRLGHTSERPSESITTKPVFAKGEVDLEALDEVKTAAYDKKAQRRGKEEDADSLGAVLMHAAGYPTHLIAQGLDILGLTLPAEIGVSGLCETFSFADYPFSPFWLKDRLQVYKQEPRLLFNLNLDSLKTHPNLQLRMERLKEMASDFTPVASVEAPTPLAKAYALPHVVGAYVMGLYDESFRLALSYHLSDPSQGEITAFLVALLMEIYKVKNYGVADQFIPKSIYGYDEDLTLVNTFLLNLRKSQIHQLAYNFLTDEGRFQSHREDHLYLRWKLSALLKRTNEAIAIKKQYSQNYPKGTYRNKMSSPY